MVTLFYFPRGGGGIEERPFILIQYSYFITISYFQFQNSYFITVFLFQFLVFRFQFHIDHIVLRTFTSIFWRPFSNTTLGGKKERYMIAGRCRTDFIIEALTIILEENTFNFDGDTYRQIKGTAMGTKVAPSFANWVMAYYEEKMYDEIGNRFDQMFKEYVIQKWKRYLGDWFIFCTQSSTSS